jgi:hypothetical protein
LEKKIKMAEIVINLHLHTRYSDGTGTHQEIAEAAIQAGLDAVLVTDHNLLVSEHEDYYWIDDKQVLMLIGEEIHDQQRTPQKNHLLVFGADQELAGQAANPQELIDQVHQHGGICFLAHPVDPAAPAVGEPDISWVSWEVSGYDGIELWNAFSEFKARLATKLHAVWYAYQPARVARGPLPENLQLWDKLLLEGKKVAAVGGSDAHALDASLGPLRRTLFPYLFHFQGVNTHLITDQELTGDISTDREIILQALSRGSSFIGYDLPASTRGFRFSASNEDQEIGMGGEISGAGKNDLTITLPTAAEIRLLRNGEPIQIWKNEKNVSLTTSTPGIYRVEAYRKFRGRQRGWIFSNPIWIRE